MKKKVYIGAAIVIVAIAMIALMVFVFSGKPAETSLELSGVWKVVKNVNEGSISIPQNEYMIFNGGEASDYRDGNPAPFAKSSYKISGDTLELPDISRTYHISQQTEQYISLYTADDTYISLVKADSEETLNSPFDPASVTGKWNVVYRPTAEPIVNEYLIFENGILADYRDNSETPSIEAAYEWNDNVINAPDLGVEMLGAKVAADRIILVDINEGYIWLLTKAED